MEMTSLAWVLREVQYSKLYYSWDSFTDTSCAESWKNSLGQLESFFCLEIHVCLGRYIHVTDVNQGFKCKRLFAGPFEGFNMCVFYVSLCFIVWAIFFLSGPNSFKMNGAVTSLTSPFPLQCLFNLTSPVQFELKVGECSCESLGLWSQANFI